MNLIERLLPIGVNHSAGRRGWKILAIVDHIMQGTLDGTDAWFHNPASQVSAHYGVGKDGRIYKWVVTSDQAWHAGVVDQPTSDLVRQNRTANPNLWTVGIEHEGYPGDIFPESQYDATLELHRTLIQDLGIVCDRQHIIGHHEINAGHAQCPGSGFPIARLMGDLAGCRS